MCVCPKRIESIPLKGRLFKRDSFDKGVRQQTIVRAPYEEIMKGRVFRCRSNGLPERCIGAVAQQADFGGVRVTPQ